MSYFGGPRYYVKTTGIVATPSDANDGRDPFGFALSGATFTNGTKTLNSAGAFSGYTYESGDVIYISGGTGVTVGVYSIASKTDDNNIVLDDDIGGTNPTDVTSSNGPKLTVNGGVNIAAADDEVFICDDGTHSVASSVPSSSIASGYRIAGASARGVEYVTASDMASIDGTMASSRLFYFNTLAQKPIVMSNLALSISGANSDAIGAGSANLVLMLYRCDITATKDGVSDSANPAVSVFMFNTKIHDCTGAGIEAGTGSNASQIIARNCVFENNLDDGASTSPNIGLPSVFTNCLFYSNGQAGLEIGPTGHSHVINCTFYGNGQGIQTRGTWTTAQLHVHDSIISDSSTWGIDWDGGTNWADEALIEHGNIFFNNGVSTNHVNLDGGGARDLHPSSQDTDPSFVSTTGGSEDFTPQASEALGTGVFPIPTR